MNEPQKDPTTAQFDQVVTEVKKQIGTIGCRRKGDKAKAFGLELSTLLLSACITVLLGLRGLSESVQTDLSNAALVLGALATVLAGTNAFFSYREQWANRTRTLRQLEEIERDLKHYKSGLVGRRPNAQKVTSFHERLGQVLRGDLEASARLRSEVLSRQSSGDDADE